MTGGSGYIGSHIAVELIQSHHEVVLLDDLSNSSPVVVTRIEQITGVRPLLVQMSLPDPPAANFVEEHVFDAVIHLAGLKSAPESVQHPATYYYNNVGGSALLMDVIRDHPTQLIFSSSATVYGRIGIDAYRHSEQFIW